MSNILDSDFDEKKYALFQQTKEDTIFHTNNINELKIQLYKINLYNENEQYSNELPFEKNLLILLAYSPSMGTVEKKLSLLKNLLKTDKEIAKKLFNILKEGIFKTFEQHNAETEYLEMI